MEVNVYKTKIIEHIFKYSILQNYEKVNSINSRFCVTVQRHRCDWTQHSH